MDNSQQQMLFAMYFSSVAGIQYHPANPPDKRLDLEVLAGIAADMLDIHNRIFGED